MKRLIKITLLAILPLAILGFNIFEDTGIYKNLFKIAGVESALEDKLTTNFGDPKRLIIVREEDPQEFDHLWNIIKNNCQKELPNWTPKIISRVAINYGTWVSLPGKDTAILIPREVPVLVANTTVQEVYEGDIGDECVFFIGTVGDIEHWLADSKANIRFIFDVIISLISITLGAILEFTMDENKKKKFRIIDYFRKKTA